MTGYTLTAVRAESHRLPADLAALLDPTTAQLDQIHAGQPVPQRVIFTGSGDSYFAARAAEHTFSVLSRIPCTVLSTQRLLDYGFDTHPVPGPGTLVVGVSASGSHAGVAAALDRAAGLGCRTLALTGTAGSLITQSADQALVVELPDRERSPGIRTYQASLLGILLLGAALAAARAADRAPLTGALDQLRRVPELVEETLHRLAAPCRQLTRELLKTPVVQLVGTGPGLATARYAAAKIIETAGMPAFGQDLEEWWHVERFATEMSEPLVVLAGPGRSHERAVRLCAQATARGHWVAALADPADEQVREVAQLILPLAPGCPDIWAPLVEHVFAGPLAVELADLLGRLPFHRR